MVFLSRVTAELEPGLFKTIEWLLDIKTRMPEANEMPKVKELNDYIEDALRDLKAQAEAVPSNRAKGYDELNCLFLDVLRETAHV